VTGSFRFPAVRTPSGTILAGVPRQGAGQGRAVVYSRVPSDDQRADLDRQVARRTEWAAGNGVPVDEVVVEVGSGMNRKRRKLARLLASVLGCARRDVGPAAVSQPGGSV